MKTETFLSRLTTRADIHINGFFTGEEVSFDFYPPPRPTPSATLVVSKPVGQTGSLDVTINYDFLGDHIRPRFSAPQRLSPVTQYGEMKHRSGRGYEATWHVGWIP
jgi:hypothetical protein